MSIYAYLLDDQGQVSYHPTLQHAQDYALVGCEWVRCTDASEETEAWAPADGRSSRILALSDLGQPAGIKGWLLDVGGRYSVHRTETGAMAAAPPVAGEWVYVAPHDRRSYRSLVSGETTHASVHLAEVYL